MLTVGQDAQITKLLTKYKNLSATKKDVISVVTTYRSLIYKLQKFVFNDGSARDLFNLQGTIPVMYKNNQYHIPICIWLIDTHPQNAPICYVKPTPTMQIKVSMYVDHNGRIYLPYLHDWKPHSSDLLSLIQVMIVTFGEHPPVYSKPKETVQPTSDASRYFIYDDNRATGGPNIPYPSRNDGFPKETVQPTSDASRYFNYDDNRANGGPNIPYPPRNDGFPPYPPVAGGSNAAAGALGGIGGAGYPPYMNFPQMPGYNANYPPSIPSSTGTITEEHIKASLISAVEDKLRRRLQEKVNQYQAEIDTLNRTKQELVEGSTKIDAIIARLQREEIELEKNLNILRDKEEELEKNLESLETADGIDPDEAVTTTAPLYRQLLNAYSEEAAIEDAIYYLSEALRSSVIDLETFLKHVRQLSRKQFMLRAIMQKCRQKAGLAG